MGGEAAPVVRVEMPTGFLILSWELGWTGRASGKTPGNCPRAGPGNADLLQGSPGSKVSFQVCRNCRLFLAWIMGGSWTALPVSQLPANSNWDKAGMDFSNESMEIELVEMS